MKNNRSNNRSLVQLVTLYPLQRRSFTSIPDPATYLKNMYRDRESKAETVDAVDSLLPTVLMSDYSICYFTYILSLCILAYILYRKYAFDSYGNPVPLRASRHTLLVVGHRHVRIVIVISQIDL